MSEWNLQQHMQRRINELQAQLQQVTEERDAARELVQGMEYRRYTSESLCLHCMHDEPEHDEDCDMAKLKALLTTTEPREP